MRLRLLLAVVLAACSSTVTSQTTSFVDGGDASPQDAGSDAVASDSGRDGQADADRTEQDASADAEASVPGLGSACDPTKTPSGCPEHFDADGSSRNATCMSAHTDPVYTGKDMYGTCTFSCYAGDPLLVKQAQDLCIALDGTCRPLNASSNDICVTNANF